MASVGTGRNAALALRWNMIKESLTRPYRVPPSLVVLVSLVPLYIFIPEFLRGRTFYKPATDLDLLIPLHPSWAFIYGALYFFLILLPVLAIRQEEHIRRTVHAYLFIWITAYLLFVLYPTAAPRGDEVAGDGFAAWGLRLLYSSDPPYNCFPSLHVAHSFVSALALLRLHRKLGWFAIGCASIVALSTLFTKQHYVVDLLGGVFLAFAAYFLFLRRYDPDAPDFERRVAPLLAALVMGVAALGIAFYWALYQFTPV